MSTRPGSNQISEQEEIDRVCTIIEMIKTEIPDAIISIDTFRSKVLNEAYSSGADILNDISGGSFDDKLWSTLADLKMPYILMHIQNTPEDMQKAPFYEDILTELVDYFSMKVSQLNEMGIYDIIIDPGFGFGKSMQHNYYLLKNLHIFKLLGLPLMIGISRKSMIYKLLNIETEASLEATTAAHMFALSQGAKILRVHDVKPASECVKLYNYINEIEC
jgi:dihydropteroate synthase